jgi:hypothetical protein
MPAKPARRRWSCLLSANSVPAEWQSSCKSAGHIEPLDSPGTRGMLRALKTNQKGFRMFIQITLATMLVACSSGPAQTRPAISKSASASTTATIQAIDSTMRTITLRDDKGQEDTFTLGPEVKRFDELKVGDTVKFTYYESIVLQVRKPGDVDKGAMTSEVGVNPSKGATPGGTLSAQDRMTVTIKAIDPVVPSLTVTTPAGRVVTRKVDDPKNIEGLKPGDQITITYTRALVTSIERQK